MYDISGLTQNEASKLQTQHGLNKLPEKKPPNSVVIFLSQLKNPLVYVLLAASLVTLVVGRIEDSVIIFLAVLINTVLGFFQERRAGKALYALKKMLHPKATVIRDSQQKQVDVENIVPGDICVLSQGTKIPADGVVLKANRFFVQEAALTGESVSVEKTTNGKVFMGTVVVSGRAYFRVETTGKNTQIGKLAQSVQEQKEATPLKKQLSVLSKQLAILVFILSVFVFAVGLIRGVSVQEIFITSVALAVSSIPEGLLVSLTVVLAVGMQKILRKKGLVRHLVSAETLGGVSTICIDKTGTLTEGKMSVVQFAGESEEKASMQGVVANDLDDPLVIAAYEWAKNYSQQSDPSEMGKKYERVDSIPFDPKERYFASLNKFSENENLLMVNGAPDYLVEWTEKSQDKESIKNKINELSLKGYRLMGMAQKKVPLGENKISPRQVQSGLEWVGILAFSDPVRVGVKESLVSTQRAGLRTIVITGDFKDTAVRVVNQIGMEIDPQNIIEGSGLQKIDADKLAEILKTRKNILFARTTPDQKLKIVEALKNNGEVVAMMGDGVNDAPAIKKSDIGIVVEGATDVARETADMILLDSSFKTIVDAIRQGRVIYDNIRKVILYLLCDSFEEIIAVLGSIVIGLPLPVTAAQILWINLVSDGFPHLALSVDPAEPGIMDKPPRDSSENIVTKWMGTLMLVVSLVGATFALTLFVLYLNVFDEGLSVARSVAFISLGINSLVFVFSTRTLTSPFWIENPFRNKWLNLAVIGGVVLQFLPFMTEGMRNFFDITWPGFEAIGLILAAGFATFIIIELVKGIIRSKLSWFSH